MALIGVTEYAKMHGKNRSTIIRKAQSGAFDSARKIGNQWVIDSEEPYIDRRIKSGKYKDWRKHDPD